MTKWRKMNSAPRDGTPILVGYWVKGKECEPHWEQFVVLLQPNDERTLIYDAWTVIPNPPHWGKE